MRVVGHADDRDLTDGRVLVDHVLDLGRVRVEAADDEHVLGAVGDARRSRGRSSPRRRRCAASRRRRSPPRSPPDRG